MKIDKPEQLGIALRASRIAQNLQLGDFAEILGTSVPMLRRQEQGKPTQALRMLFSAMHELGIEMHLELPPKAQELARSLSAEALAKKRVRL